MYLNNVNASIAITEGVSGYLIAANRLYIHHISLDGSRMNVAVSGLKYAVAVDFHFRTNSLYWTDSSRRAIMKSTLDGTKLNILLDHGLTQPGIQVSTSYIVK